MGCSPGASLWQRAGGGSASASPSCSSSWLSLPAGDGTVTPWIPKPRRSAHAGCVIKAPISLLLVVSDVSLPEKLKMCVCWAHSSHAEGPGCCIPPGSDAGTVDATERPDLFGMETPGKMPLRGKGGWWRSCGIAEECVKQRHRGLRVAFSEDCQVCIHGCCFQPSPTTREETGGALRLRAGEPIRGAPEALSQG